jgi:acid phosphatase (class A)
LGNWYTYRNLPITAAFLSDIYRDATYYFFKLKLSINRPRPYMLEKRLDVLEKPSHPAYPSGHSAASYINAYIMIEIAPELADSFTQRAAEMAYSREVLGVHYPSDSEIGRVWARAFVNELFKKENFNREFEKAKKEILDLRRQMGNKGKSKMESNETGSCSESCGSSCGNCNSACCKSQ